MPALLARSHWPATGRPAPRTGLPGRWTARRYAAAGGHYRRNRMFENNLRNIAMHRQHIIVERLYGPMQLDAVDKKDKNRRFLVA